MTHDPASPPDSYLEHHPNDEVHGYVSCERCDGTGWLYTDQDRSDLEHGQALLLSPNIGVALRSTLLAEIHNTGREVRCPDCNGRGEVLA